MSRARTFHEELTRREFVAVPMLVALSGVRWPFGSERSRGRKTKHPDPRPGVTADRVLPASRFEDRPRVGKVYDMAREMPEVLDGLYCHCECDASMSHRSLLSCFESDQAAGCYMCREELHVAYKLHKRGKSLAEIRRAVDEEFR